MRVAGVVVTAGLAAGLLVGCGSDGGDDGDGNASPRPTGQPNRIVVATGSPPRTLDAAQATRRSEQLIATATQLPLLTYRHRTGDDAADLEPALARDLPRLSDDRLEYRFTLRPGLVYSDGRLVKASDVERAIAHASRTAANPRLRTVLAGIVGAPSTDGETLRGVRTDDRNGAVVVRLRDPDGRVPQTLADPATAPIPELPADDPRVLPAATGPLRVARVAGTSVELVANPLRAKIDTVPAARTAQVSVLGRPARAGETAGGTVGVAFDVDGTSSSTRPATVTAASGTQWVLLVAASGPFAARADREALAEAIDRRLLADLDAGRASCGLLPAWTVGATTRDDCPPVPVRSTGQPLLGETVRLGVPPGIPTPSSEREAKDLPATTPDGATLSGPDAVSRTGAAAEAIVLRALDEVGAFATANTVASAESALARGELDAALVRIQPRLPHPSDYLRPVGSVDLLVTRQLPEQTSKPLTGAGGAWSDLERRAIDRAVAIPISSESTTVAVGAPVDPSSVVLHPVLGLDLAALRLR